MSYAIPGLPRSYRYPREAGWTSFAGGLNNRDDASELGPADVIQAFNVTFDERGGFAARLGYTQFLAFYVTLVPVTGLYWSPLLNTWLAYTSSTKNLYKGSNTTIRKTFTTSEPVVFAELNGKVYVGHPTDGIFSSPDGVTWTALASANKPATCVALAVWQNKLWAVLKASSRVQFSDAGDGTAWTANNWIDIREKDDAAIVALHIGSGQDIIGRPGLFAFKQESGYRIHDGATGAFETVDSTVGCANAAAVIGVGGYVYTLGRRGIFRWAAGKLGAVDMSAKLQKLWDPTQIDLTQTALWCAGRYHNRAVFSLTRLGSTWNDLALELHTEQGWLATGSNAMSCYMTSQGTEEQLYGATQQPVVADIGAIHKLYSGSNDGGTAAAWVLQTRWLDLSSGFKAMVQQLKLRGRGGSVGPGNALAVESRIDYQQAGTSRNVILTTSGADEGLVTLYGIGAARQLSLVFSAANLGGTFSGPKIAQGSGGTIAAPPVGGFAVFSALALYTRLGMG